MGAPAVAVVTACRLVAEAMTARLDAADSAALCGVWTGRYAAFDDWVCASPDAAVIDRDLLGFDPLGFIEAVRDALGVPLLIRAHRPSVEYVHLVLTAGAGGVICATASSSVTLQALEDVAAGRSVVPHDLREALQERLLRGDALSYRALSVKERQVAGRVASGATAKEAGERLVITEATVRKHLSHIYAKLGVRGHTELLLTLVRLGMLDVEHLEHGQRPRTPA